MLYAVTRKRRSHIHWFPVTKISHLQQWWQMEKLCGRIQSCDKVEKSKKIMQISSHVMWRPIDTGAYMIHRLWDTVVSFSKMEKFVKVQTHQTDIAKNNNFCRVPDTASQCPRTSSDENQLSRRLASPASGPKICAWTDYKASPHQQVVVVCIYHSQKNIKNTGRAMTVNISLLYVPSWLCCLLALITLVFILSIL